MTFVCLKKFFYIYFYNTLSKKGIIGRIDDKVEFSNLFFCFHCHEVIVISKILFDLVLMILILHFCN